MARRQPIGYYICTGNDPFKDSTDPVAAKGSVEIFSFLLHVLILIRIQIYKRKLSVAVGPQTLPIFHNRLTLGDIETRSLSSFRTNVVNVAMLCLTFINVVVLNKLKPSDLNRFPIVILVYYAFLVSPGLLALLCTLLYYFSHKPLRTTIKTEIKEKFLKFWDAVKK